MENDVNVNVNVNVNVYVMVMVMVVVKVMVMVMGYENVMVGLMVEYYHASAQTSKH